MSYYSLEHLEINLDKFYLFRLIFCKFSAEFRVDSGIALRATFIIDFLSLENLPVFLLFFAILSIPIPTIRNIIGNS